MFNMLKKWIKKKKKKKNLENSLIGKNCLSITARQTDGLANNYWPTRKRFGFKEYCAVNNAWGDLLIITFWVKFTAIVHRLCR